MSDPTEVQVLLSMAQALPGDATGQQRVLRTLAQLVAPSLLEDGASQDLANGDLAFTSDFGGPWTARMVALKFLVDDGAGNLIPNIGPKDFSISIVLGGEAYALVERYNSIATGFVLTDAIALGPNDQLAVHVHGSGVAKVQVRGEKR